MVSRREKKKTRRPANIRAQTQTPVPNPSARHDSRGKLLRACLIKGGKVCAAREGVALRQQQGDGAVATVGKKNRRGRRQLLQERRGGDGGKLVAMPSGLRPQLPGGLRPQAPGVQHPQVPSMDWRRHQFPELQQ
jgi:hypothetical protein